MNLPSFLWSVPSPQDSSLIVSPLQFAIKEGFKNLLPVLCFIVWHTDHTHFYWSKRAGRAIPACHRCVPGLLWLLPLSPVLLRAPGSYRSHLQLSAGQGRGWQEESKQGPGSAKRITPHHHHQPLWHCLHLYLLLMEEREGTKQRCRQTGTGFTCFSPKAIWLCWPLAESWLSPDRQELALCQMLACCDTLSCHVTQNLQQHSQKMLRPKSAITYTGR